MLATSHKYLSLNGTQDMATVLSYHRQDQNQSPGHPDGVAEVGTPPRGDIWGCQGAPPRLQHPTAEPPQLRTLRGAQPGAHAMQMLGTIICKVCAKPGASRINHS